MRWAGHVARIEGCKIYVLKPEGKRPLGRTRRRRDDISMDLTEIRLEEADWMHLFQDRHQWWDLVNTVMNLWIS
jgi:hypothetical protein